MADNPSPPHPTTVTVSPGLMWMALVAAPKPVVNPQPSRQMRSNGKWLSTFSTESSGVTEYSA